MRTELTDLGRTQASQSATSLKGMVDRGDFDLKEIISSTMTRARQTAEIIHTQFYKIPYIMDEELVEGHTSKPST